MGEKLGGYIDLEGNIVRDGDEVVWKGKVYEVIYVSWMYVNLQGHGNLHLPFKVGTPKKLHPNREATMESGTLKELNVKPGDVVKYYGEKEYTVAEGNKLIHPGGNIQPYDGWDTVGYFSIVSRAAPEPKLWKDMSPEEKGALLLAEYEGKTIEFWNGPLGWVEASPLWDSYRAYRVKPEPVVETVALYNDPNGGWSFYEDSGTYKRSYSITFDLVDGKPDCNSIKMEEI